MTDKEKITILPQDRENQHIKKFYYNDTEYIEIGIPKGSNPVSVFISGGVDSALVTYMVVKTIQELNLGLEVYPITTEFMSRPFNINRSWAVLRMIEKLTGFIFSQNLIFPMPNHALKISDEEKKPIMSQNLKLYFEKYGISMMYNGLTANPPIDLVPNNIYGQRQLERDDVKLVKLKLNQKKTQFPLLWSNKRIVAELYHRLGIHNSIFPLTRSCESEMEESKYFTKTCFQVRDPGKECWWCRERQYGFNHLFPQEFCNTKEKT